MTILASHLALVGWDVSLLTYGLNDSTPYAIDERVNVVFMDPFVDQSREGRLAKAFGGRWVRAAKRLWGVRVRVLQSRPDVVLSFIDKMNISAIVALAGTGVPVVVSERMDPALYRIGRAWEWLRLHLYQRASAVVVQSGRARHFFPSNLQDRIFTIPNPVLAAPVEREEREGGGRLLIAMGRLVSQKGFDLLLEAFALIAPQHPDWTLEIWGEGPERESLEKQIEQLALRRQVSLPGRTTMPLEQLRRADLFVLSSRFEGFPNVLGEALATGIPAVSFDCLSGPREVLRDGLDGLLVPPGDVPALAKALADLMGDEGRRKSMGRRAPEVVSRFDVGAITQMWTEVLAQAAGIPAPVPPKQAHRGVPDHM